MGTVDFTGARTKHRSMWILEQGLCISTVFCTYQSKIEGDRRSYAWLSLFANSFSLLSFKPGIFDCLILHIRCILWEAQDLKRVIRKQGWELVSTCSFFLLSFRPGNFYYPILCPCMRYTEGPGLGPRTKEGDYKAKRRVWPGEQRKPGIGFVIAACFARYIAN